jgi:hypothetical protein
LVSVNAIEQHKEKNKIIKKKGINQIS